MPAPTINRADVRKLGKTQEAAIKAAQRELGMIWRETDGLPPAQRRDALIELTSALVSKYQDLSSTAAADWYELMRARWFDDEFEVNPFEANPNDDATLRRVLRACADRLFPESANYNPEAYLTYLSDIIGRNIRQAGRATVARNVSRDPRKPRWGRVTSGSETCMFCFMLASRGFVYRSRDTAMEGHCHCDCQVVPEFKPGANRIKGYDPSAMSDIWQAAVEEAGTSSKLSAIFAALRRQNPTRFGV